MKVPLDRLAVEFRISQKCPFDSLKRRFATNISQHEL